MPVRMPGRCLKNSARTGVSTTVSSVKNAAEGCVARSLAISCAACLRVQDPFFVQGLPELAPEMLEDSPPLEDRAQIDWSLEFFVPQPFQQSAEDPVNPQGRGNKEAQRTAAQARVSARQSLGRGAAKSSSEISIFRHSLPCHADQPWYVARIARPDSLAPQCSRTRHSSRFAWLRRSRSAAAFSIFLNSGVTRTVSTAVFFCIWPGSFRSFLSAVL